MVKFTQIALNKLPNRFSGSRPSPKFPYCYSVITQNRVPVAHDEGDAADFINHVRLKTVEPIPEQQGVRVTKRSEVIAFPAKKRVRDIQRCVQALENLHGSEADRFWREECRALAAHLINLGYDEASMRRDVMEFQNAVQMQLWTDSQAEELARRDSY